LYEIDIASFLTVDFGSYICGIPVDDFAIAAVSHASDTVMGLFNVKERRMIRLAWMLVLPLMLFPYQTDIVPAWRIRVVTEPGHPLRRLTVSQTWTNPSLEFFWFEEDLLTDEEGYVNFPKRTAWENLLALGCHKIWKVISTRSGSPDASVFGWHDNLNGGVKYQKGDVLPSVLVMK
jgi:hypothetical protein